MSQRWQPPQTPWRSFSSTSKSEQPTALSVKPVNVTTRRPVPSAKPTPRPKGPSQPTAIAVKHKSPFELAYEESLAQLHLLEEKLRHQTSVFLQLERNTLDYYYTNTICFVDYDGEQAPQKNSGLHHYYFNSVVSKARRERRERRAREERQLEEEQRRVELVEEDVRKHIINGDLAEQREAVKKSEEENIALQQHLTDKQTESENCRQSLKDNEERQRAMQQECVESARRIQRLEEGKQKQMDNVDATRLTLSRAREELAAAKAELEKREKVVNDLRETIARLSRRRRQRE